MKGFYLINLYLITVLTFSFFVNESCCVKKRDVASLKFFGTCEGHKVPNGFFNTSTNYIGRGITVVNADLIINVPAKVVVGSFSLLRCLTTARINCEEILSFETPDLCERYEKTNQYYSTFLEHIEPKYRCPMVAKTHYKLRNGTFDSALLLPILNKFPFAYSSYWLLKNYVFRKKDKLELNCVDFLVKIERVAVKSK